MPSSLSEQKARAAKWAEEQGYDVKHRQVNKSRKVVKLVKTGSKKKPDAVKKTLTSRTEYDLDVAKQKAAAAKWAQENGYIDKYGKPTKKAPRLTHDQEIARQREKARAYARSIGLFK